MGKGRLSLGLIVALLAAIAFATFNPATPPPAATPAPVAVSVNAPEPAPAELAWTAPVWTGGERNAQQHWEKHGREFPEFSNKQAYVDGVHTFLLKPPRGTLVKHRDNGDTLYFNPDSGIFAVQASNGAPRTFFKPDNGMAYWNRQ